MSNGKRSTTKTQLGAKKKNLTISGRTRDEICEGLETTIGELMIIEKSQTDLSSRKDFDRSYQSLFRVMFFRIDNISRYLSGELKEYNPELEVTIY